MTSDQDERAWWVFRLPEATAYVPAATEAAARAAIERDAYKGAPVDSWPCVGSRFTSREMLSAELLRKAGVR